MTIYGHLELNTDQHKHPNTSYNAYTCCTKRIQAFGGLWGGMGGYKHQYATVSVGRDLAYTCRPIHVLVFIFHSPHRPTYTILYMLREEGERVKERERTMDQQCRVEKQLYTPRSRISHLPFPRDSRCLQGPRWVTSRLGAPSRKPTPACPRGAPPA